ncbi:Rrf2 family transcriptional regulator [Nitrosococcus watsonii]|uniref:Transcriptional regulator, BadM/Rrf2 family n=1 Tax=Nitrosococcus watsoni (strain C-113) TaxID=105559 RepID=D8K5Z5_NITWC|nr:Rrf2 family transcriptional regulator [Nitrosococcus watsonii]ADJ28322.1 transcriptional regulator, BadM/Rrf2 family [Nitrosococcus watsonii C-113]
MRFSNRPRYAISAMMNLALVKQQETVTLGDIAQLDNISVSYLEQIFASLRHHGLVEGIRGPGGGYHLTRTAEKITIAEIIAAVDKQPGKLNPLAIATNSVSEAERLWHDFSTRLYDFLNQITLADLAQRWPHPHPSGNPS